MADVPTRAAVSRSRRLTALLCVVLAVPGLVLSATTKHEIQILGGFLFGVAVTVAIARVFYEVGIGEDRDRAERPAR